MVVAAPAEVPSEVSPQVRRWRPGGTAFQVKSMGEVMTVPAEWRPRRKIEKLSPTRQLLRLQLNSRR